MPSKLFIISGPSGAGEDSVIKGLKEIMDIEKVVTTTTRSMRPTEEEGREYYFVSKDEFQNKIDNNDFFEWAEEDNGQLYGGTKAELDRVKSSGKIGIWKVDYKGVLNAKKIEPEAISIFIKIPIEAVENRLRQRGNVTEDFIKDRIEYARGWYENEDKFDYIVKNKQGQLAETIQKVAEIIIKSPNIK